MQLTKHIGCLLALVFATASAFADATWFTTPFSSTLDSLWSGSKTALTIDNNVIKLNNWNDENELVYTPADHKTLPGDEATIRTKVKFTAMDKADFDAQKDTIPDGAKGGLTIVEDSDATSAETAFWVIADGEWTKVSGQADVIESALAGPVDVEVKISKNGDTTSIAYIVGSKTIFSGEADIGIGENANKISSVSYKGVCEISELEGIAAKSVFDLTLPAIANTKAQYKIGNATEWEEYTGPVQVTSGTDGAGAVSVQYVALSGYFLSGGTSTWSANALLGDTSVPATEFGDLQSRQIVVYLNDDTSTPYATIADALKEASANDTIKLVAAAPDAAIAVNESVAFELYDTASEVIVTAPITVASGKTLTIIGGNYTGLLAGTVELKGGKFAEESFADGVDPQDWCAAKYFVEDLTADHDYAYTVVEGQEIKDDNLPAIAVDPAEIPVGKNPATYLKEKVSSEEGSMPRWVSYALGYGTAPEAEPEPEMTIQDDPTDTTKVKIIPSFKPLKSTGVAITYQVGTGAKSENAPEILLESLAAEVAHKYTVKVFAGDTEVEAAQTTIGVNKVTPADGKRTLVTVPWCAGRDGEELALKELFKVGLLTEGDKVEIHNQASDTYTVRVWDGTAWVAESSPSLMKGTAGNDEITVKRGQAIWFTAKDSSKAICQIGIDGEGPVSVPATSGNWGFFAVPLSENEGVNLSEIIAPVANVTVQIEKDDGKTYLYQYNEEKKAWGYEDYVGTGKYVRGKEVMRKDITIDDPTIAPGHAFWLENKSGADKNLSL